VQPGADAVKRVGKKKKIEENVTVEKKLSQPYSFARSIRIQKREKNRGNEQNREFLL
jgi:hypothetical protein